MVKGFTANALSPGFPAPVLTLSEPTIPEGKVVTVTCSAGARVLVALDGIPAVLPGQPTQLQLNATEDDDRRSFFCDATLGVDGETLSKNKSAELRVLCELAFNLSPPRDFQGPVQPLALLWKWGFSSRSMSGFSVSHAPARRRPSAGRFGLSQELDVA